MGKIRVVNGLRKMARLLKPRKSVIIILGLDGSNLGFRFGSGISKVNLPVFRVLKCNYPGNGSGFG